MLPLALDVDKKRKAILKIQNFYSAVDYSLNYAYTRTMLWASVYCQGYFILLSLPDCA